MAHVAPTNEQIERFRDLTRDGVVHMLNLVRLRPRATYADGRETSGEEAYRAFTRESTPVIERVGGKHIYLGRFELTVVGPADERWDHVFIVAYPSGAAFGALMRDPVYRAALQHQQAAVEDARVIRLEPTRPDARFGEGR